MLTILCLICAGPQEERSSAHEAFMHALESAKPVKLRMPGLQEFAAAVSGGCYAQCTSTQIPMCQSPRLVCSSADAGIRNNLAAPVGPR